MIRNLDTDLLRTFVAVVDQDGFAKAGNALGRSQSAVSMQMKRLEDVVGCALFRREGRRMRLTASGELLLGFARRIVRLNDQTLDVIRDSGVEGRVTLAVMGDYATHVLPGLLADFIDLNPNISIEVTTGMSAELITHLGEKYDIVLATQPQGVGGGIILRTEQTRWAFSDKHELPEASPVPLALLPPGNMFREWALKALGEAEVEWRAAFTSTSIATVEAAALAGIAVAVVKQGTATPGLRFLDRRHGLPDLPPSEIALHIAPGARSKAVQSLANFLIDRIKDDAGGRSI
ncbi:MAG: LysR substrate-binding domain-containing protein [Alphaproteobacteria bacterium]